jgi:DHA2 family multidrug resistance protein
MGWVGLPQLVIIPLVPILLARVDMRFIVGAGLTVFATGCLFNIHMSPDYAGDQLIVANIVRSFGQAVILGPLAVIAVTNITPAKAGSASGIYNMSRNLGGAIGTAALQTFLTKREQYHPNVIGSGFSLFSESARHRIAAMKNFFMSRGAVDGAYAEHEAIIAIGRQIHRNAAIMGFSDAFGFIGIVVLIAAAATPFVRKLATAGAPAGH